MTDRDEVYETIRVREGRIPFLTAHLARLGAGAAELGIRVAPGLDERIRAAAAASELVLRVTVATGSERIEPRPVPAERLVRIVIATLHHAPYRLKTTHRETFERARAEAAQRGANEALLLTADGLLAEGTITAVAFWGGGEAGALCLPDLALGILPSIGRARLIELARDAGITVRTGSWTREDWVGKPLLLVNSVRGMMEAETLEGQPLPTAREVGALVSRFWPSPS